MSYGVLKITVRGPGVLATVVSVLGALVVVVGVPVGPRMVL